MSLYQVKLIDGQGSDRYHTFLAQDVGDTIKQATEKRKLAIENIGEVRALLAGDDIYDLVHRLLIEADGTFVDLKVFVESAHGNFGQDIDFVNVDVNLHALKDKTEKLVRLVEALRAILDDGPEDFGYDEKEGRKRIKHLYST